MQTIWMSGQCMHTHTTQHKVATDMAMKMISFFTFFFGITQAPVSHQKLHTSLPHDISLSQPGGEHSYAVLDGRASILDQQRHMKRIHSCGSLDSNFHRYFSKSQRHLPYSYAIPEGRVSVLDQPRCVRRIYSCGSLDFHSHRYYSKKQKHLPYSYAIPEGRVSVSDQQRCVRQTGSCGSLDSHSHRYFSKSQR